MRVVADNINYFILKYQTEKAIFAKASWLKKAIISLWAAVKRDGVQSGAYYSKDKALKKLEELRANVEDLMRKAAGLSQIDPVLFIELDGLADEFVEVFIGCAYDAVPLVDTIEQFMQNLAQNKRFIAP